MPSQSSRHTDDSSNSHINLGLNTSGLSFNHGPAGSFSAGGARGNSPPPFDFPRHVRKTSFDHTVSQETMFPGLTSLGGRHQVNGRPLSPHGSTVSPRSGMNIGVDVGVGMKRRADAPHAESLLRGDLTDLEMNMGNSGGFSQSLPAHSHIHSHHHRSRFGPHLSPTHSHNHPQHPSRHHHMGSGDGADHSSTGGVSGPGSPFPTTNFNFSFPSYDDNSSYDGNGAPTNSAGSNGFETQGYEGYDGFEDGSVVGPRFGSARSSISGPAGHPRSPYIGSPPNDLPGHHSHHPNHAHGGHSHHASSSSGAGSGLSPAAATASAVMAEGYARLSAANGIDDMTGGGLGLGGMGAGGSAVDYTLMGSLGSMYSGLEDSPTGTTNPNGPFTHVDPTQILAGSGGVYTHASPSSDGWGPTSTALPPATGPGSSASPEPSSASTPPSGVEGGSGSMFTTGRKYAPLKGDDKRRRNGLGESLRSGSSTPDLDTNSVSVSKDGKGSKSGGEDGDNPTLCTNCRTTNTPLWRRDPEGQPLCEFFSVLVSAQALMINSRR